MDEPVTWGTLGLVLASIAAIAFVLGGVFIAFAAGMSSNPSEAKRIGKQGCTVFVIGLIVAAYCIWRWSI